MTARVTRIFLKRNNKRGIRPVFYFAYSLPCYCEAVRSTLKTLAYDCGNPVQYVCGHSPAVLFYLLDRRALLAMTRGRKGIILHSLTTPPEPPTRHVARGPVLGHPSNGGELGTYRRGAKFPSAEGWRALRDGVVIYLHSNKKRGGAPFFIPYCRRILNT